MEELREIKNQANTLRKSGNLKEALPIYEKLFDKEVKDRFDSAGYLHCLRKLKKYDEAMKVAAICEELFTNFNWMRTEIIWTYISNLKQMTETEPIDKFLSIANKVLFLEPDDVQTNITVLTVLKKAKQMKKWDIATQWVDKLNVLTLNKEPLVANGKTTIWSDYLIWQKYKVTCLIFEKKYQEAIYQLNLIRSDIKQVEKFFLVLEAEAFKGIGELQKSIDILTKLARNPKADWWIIHRYSLVLNEVGKKEHSLKEMYRAASLSRKLENSIKLFRDIFWLAKELDKLEEAHYHLLLFRMIREHNDWPVHEEVEKQIKLTGEKLKGDKVQTYHEVLRKCRSYWGQDISTVVSNKSIQRNLKGKLIKVKSDRPFCFVKTQSESFFCNKSEIKGEPVEGLAVKFDVIPTFDQKKQQDSWKAINISFI